jgi:iron-sulfur cluster repair protein YtfE (RIC family)
LRKPICEIEREYGNVVGAVVKMRALTADYSLPGEPGGSFAALNEALRKLDEDLRKQIHLESNVLFPLAIELEKLSTG